ncbi:hypothetical protein C8Q72DRAFT_183392 [Fomitopsis betulina]|nr:hypothetical protein C8Q72DRAFT_183392 [Fomitopsis betulina]
MNVVVLTKLLQRLSIALLCVYEHSMFRAPWPIHCAGACLLPVLLSTLIRVPKPNSIHKLIPGAAAHAVAYQRSRTDVHHRRAEGCRMHLTWLISCRYLYGS